MIFRGKLFVDQRVPLENPLSCWKESASRIRCSKASPRWAMGHGDPPKAWKRNMIETTKKSILHMCSYIDVYIYRHIVIEYSMYTLV